MRIKTFYNIFYRHRVQKANIFLKVYILIILPFRYLMNIPYLPKVINLDFHSKKNSELFKKEHIAAQSENASYVKEKGYRVVSCEIKTLKKKNYVIKINANFERVIKSNYTF